MAQQLLNPGVVFIIIFPVILIVLRVLNADFQKRFPSSDVRSFILFAFGFWALVLLFIGMAIFGIVKLFD
jgi:hypothetical protein